MQISVILAGVLLSVAVITAQAASYDCPAKPTEDIIITPAAVELKGSSVEIRITPAGEVMRQGKVIAVSKESRQQAEQYQAALRKELPLLEQQIGQKLDQAGLSLDKIITRQLGVKSKVRSHLHNLSIELRKTLALIVEKRNATTLIFHHQGIAAAEKEGRAKIEHALGAVLQDSLNEMGAKSLAQQGENPLQAMLGGVGDLQKAIRDEWKQQEQDFRRFGEETCTRIIQLEEQKKRLLSGLPSGNGS